MNSDKWLKRKYPNSYNKIREILDDQELEKFKKSRRKIGILKSDIIYCQKYPEGTMFMYQHQKDIDEEGWTGGFRYYCEFKCQKGYTESGYHAFLKWDLDFEEIKR